MWSGYRMVEDPMKEHIVETRAEEIDVVHVQPPELDVQTVHLGREPRLSQVSLVVVDAQDPGPTPTETLSVEPRVAPDVQDRAARQVLGEMPPDVQPDLLEEVAERMVRCRPNPMSEVDVVNQGPVPTPAWPETRNDRCAPDTDESTADSPPKSTPPPARTPPGQLPFP